MRFFFDNNLALRLARGFKAFLEGEHEVVHLRERFPPDKPDVEWMSELAKEPSWVIISGDVRIGKTPHEIAAWQAAGHTIFFLKASWMHIPFWQQVHKLAKCFPDIIERARRAKPGAGFQVTIHAKIEDN